MNEDLRLRTEVEREIGWEPTVASTEIGVGVKDGVVTLMGVVDSYAAKRAAERAASRVAGVKAVGSQIEVKPTGPRDRTDADIAWAAANVLAWNTLLPANQIRIDVSRGWITLEGAVEWRFQKTAAEESISNLTGITGVTNLIEIIPTIPPEEMEDQIENALKQIKDMDWRRIIVETDGRVVMLWGLADSPAHSDAAEKAAWSVPGVSEVANHIKVDSP
jgi:osmotically-inducible protein OsmY